MFRGGRIRQRVVIDISTAERIGYVTDVEFNEITGSIEAVVVNKHTGIFSALFGIGERCIPWESIVVMGKEFVLAKTFEFEEKCLKN